MKSSWKIEYNNDIGQGESFWEWWSVSNEVRTFTCQSEADALWLKAALDSLPD